MAEHSAVNRRVIGSSPLFPANKENIDADVCVDGVTTSF